MSSLSIVILTLNEERHIEDCIRSAAGLNAHIIVIDSGSTDTTVARARALGAEVHVHADWQGFGMQRSRALSHIQTDWVFFLDADERLTAELANEMADVVALGQEEGVWEVTWEQMAFGQSLKHMGHSVGIPRLFPVRAIERFEGEVHEGAMLRHPLTTRRLHARLPHYSRETVHASLVKLAQYVQLGALKRRRAGVRGGVFRGLASGFANFLRLYLFQRGFLCGRAGFLYSLFVGLECFFRYVAIETDAAHGEPPSRR